MTKTAVFIDVDGVINHIDRYRQKWPGEPARFEANGFPIDIPAHVPALIRYLAREFDAYWLTTWREDANTWIAPKIGIDPLPVLTDGTNERHVGWKAEVAQAKASELFEAGYDEIFWIEDFYGDIPFIPDVQFVDTGRTTVLLPQHLPNRLLPRIWRGRSIEPVR